MKILIILMLNLGISQVTYAKHHCDNMKGYKTKMEKVYDSLDLTDEQEKAIKSIKAKYRSEKKALYMKYKDYKGQMRDIMQSGSIDEAKLNELIKVKQNMVAEKIKLRANKMSAIYKLLTPEQREKMKEMKKIKRCKKKMTKLTP